MFLGESLTEVVRFYPLTPAEVPPNQGTRVAHFRVDEVLSGSIRVGDEVATLYGDEPNPGTKLTEGAPNIVMEPVGGTQHLVTCPAREPIKYNGLDPVCIAISGTGIMVIPDDGSESDNRVWS